MTDPRINTKKKGFTLIETIVAISIGTFVAIMLTTISTAGLKQIKHSYNSQRLHANAVFVVDIFTYWTKQSRNLSTPSAQALAMELEDGTIKTLTETDNAITLDGNAITTDDIEITSIAFTKLARSAQIDFTMKREGYDETFSVTTTVAMRNN